MQSFKNKSSITFIDEESLVPASGWDDSDSSKARGSSLRRTFKKIRSYPDPAGSGFPSGFKDYLVSQKSVLVRLLSSLLPPFGRFQRIAVDPQGTFLSIFILTAVIYWGFVSSRGVPRLLALTYSAPLSVFYVLLASIAIMILSSLTKTLITFRQTFSVMGYGLFGHALTLLVCEAISDDWFLTALTIFGGLATGRLCFILFARTPKPALRFVICTPVGIAHLLYLVYLHFAIMRN